jgi:hypothetical protein
MSFSTERCFALRTGLRLRSRRVLLPDMFEPIECVDELCWQCVGSEVFIPLSDLCFLTGHLQIVMNKGELCGWQYKM